jgi:hypothetical protein
MVLRYVQTFHSPATMLGTICTKSNAEILKLLESKDSQVLQTATIAQQETLMIVSG